LKKTKDLRTLSSPIDQNSAEVGLRLSTDLPVVVEIVDTLQKIEAFLPVVDHAILEGLATLERVQIRFYRSGKT
jgi:PII-like signaling protein